ncbi:MULTISPECIES: hypothetical protein [Elizabethkingia]|uniref:Uncharacterized protein n=1 Tax=Elizabethkingia meningoseptica TaxID=238 RepID=A0A1V3U1D3_ELIME|nr:MULTISPECIES: hypothetical protein [Elizabethkingia]AQX12125.1 hypothetical protein BBD35_06935 [Elizabethkingia meningoseptica]MBG0513640.1 hypothetical protein [Elizabethkingia meningoseptica]MDE5434952.1 hypothetical protein [Elizabethkingia meningoseptica]MDE5482488.1 hypothetical protein [Elizabethkingia meningoseptica]MDE5537554.1 hypothetical protein [Elizabethkingia meningoseptica]
MKNIVKFLLFLISTTVFSQSASYKLENAVSYSIKDDFYSNFLNILSTSDYSTNIFIVATPMGNIATLNIGDKFYAVYSDDGKLFKIDTTETLDRNKYKNNDDPDLNLRDNKNTFTIKNTNTKETIKNNQCDVYSISGKEGNSETLCIDTTSKLNTVPFLLPSVTNLKGLVYRLGNKIELNYSGTIENLGKEEEEQDDDEDEETTKTNEVSSNKQKNFIIEFDEKAETENYKKEYSKKKSTVKNKRL